MARGRHHEAHHGQRIGWLRAAVLGANDGIVSTASLMVGVAAANVARGELLLAGVAGLMCLEACATAQQENMFNRAGKSALAGRRSWPS